MPNAGPHFTVGVFLGIATALGSGAIMYELTQSLITVSSAATLAFLFTLAGAMGPDIDHHKSYIFRLCKNLTTFCVVVATIWLEYRGWDLIIGFSRFLISVTNFIEMSPFQLSLVIAFILVSFLGGATVETIYMIKPVHGGITHTVKANTAFSIIQFPVLYFVFRRARLPDPVLLAGVSAASWLIGALSHRFMDDLFNE